MQSSMNCEIARIGALATPVVRIDGAVANPDRWRTVAKSLQWAERGANYPGPRADAPREYLLDLAGPLRLALGQVFGWRSEVDVLRCYFSLATTPGSQLSPLQRIPHVDSYDPEQIAFVHYLCDPELGGTAFYRQRSTGLERIDSANSAMFENARDRELEQISTSPSAYLGTDDPWFEQIHLCPAAYNRIVFFPCNQLHCADLADATLPRELDDGRLTVAGFLRPGYFA